MIRPIKILIYQNPQIVDVFFKNQTLSIKFDLEVEINGLWFMFKNDNFSFSDIEGNFIGL